MAKEIDVNLSAVNIEALDAELRAALGKNFSGLRCGKTCTIILTDDVSAAEINAALSIALAHDPTKLSPAQQQAEEQAAKLDAQRKANKGDLDTSKFNDPLVGELAQKIAWLEQEIIALRAGR